ncbi:MAG: DUF2119 domain-containing protein [archaeon]|nr:DUF2119 domain-containing protein [archaeon]
MSYFRYIDNGEGPTKLFIGGIHGNEGKTIIKILRKLKSSDFSNGQIYIYNFDKSPYISTLKKEFYDSFQGKKIISLIEKHKPDFYTELHSYHLKNYDKLLDENRLESQGVPPLISCDNHVLVSSVSPLIRQKYFTRDTICKTLEIPAFAEYDFDNTLVEKYDFDLNLTLNRYFDFLDLICSSKNRKDFENRIWIKYPNQVKLAMKYVKYVWDENFPPY